MIWTRKNGDSSYGFVVMTTSIHNEVHECIKVMPLGGQFIALEDFHWIKLNWITICPSDLRTRALRTKSVWFLTLFDQ